MGLRCSHMAGGPFSRDGEMVLKQTGSASGPTYKTPVCSVACSWEAPKCADWISDSYLYI